MIYYDKIIRDGIPEIIKKDNRKYDIEKVTDEVALEYLKKKLTEELEEFYENDQIEELIDIMEVIEAIATKKGVSFDKLLKIKEEKKKKRGGFEENLVLKKVY